MGGSFLVISGLAGVITHKVKGILYINYIILALKCWLARKKICCLTLGKDFGQHTSRFGFKFPY